MSCQDTTCFNCGDELADCNCGDTETYDNSEGPICPYCGYMNKACDSDGRMYNEEFDTHSCWDCGKDFDVSVSVSFSWTGTRPDE